MLDNLLGNKTNILILRFLARFDKQFFSIDEIVKETGAGLRNVKDSLRILFYEHILVKRNVGSKIHYKFIVDSRFKDLISNLFYEEKQRITLNSNQNYKLISEIESKINKIVGANLINIFIFGRTAKRTDTLISDIDI